MCVYQFKIWGKRLAVDIGTGNFFEVDKIGSETITLLQGYPEEEVKEKLRKRYKTKSIIRTVSNLSELKRKGIIFSKDRATEPNIKRKITDLTLNVVNNCNLHCRYCWNRAGAYGGSSGKTVRMHRGIAFKAIELLIKESKGDRDLVIDFYGGEPLLNFQLIEEVVNYCKDIQKNKRIKFRFLLATNGTLLTKDRSEFMIKNGVDIAVSLDGSREIQNIQRPFSNGKGSFDIILDNINSLKDAYRRRIVGRATFTPYSARPIDTFKFLRGLGFDRIEVCESEKAGYGLEPNSRFFFSGHKGLCRLKALYYDLALFYTREIISGNLTYENTYFNRFFKQLSRLYHIQSIVGTCSAGFSLMSIDMDGSIYPCTAFVGLPQFQIGNVGVGIEENKLKTFSVTKIYSSSACNRCWAKRICLGCGSCYNLNYFTNKNLNQPHPYYCELFRYKTKLMIAMIAKINESNPLLLDKVLIPEYYARRGKRNA